MTTTEPIAYTRTQAARLLQVGRTTFWRLEKTGKIKVTNYGRIPRAELERHLNKEAK
jgi:excisionase family DNA binding protein